MRNAKNLAIGILAILWSVAFALGVACFFLTGYFTENIIGSPSSTSVLIFIFIPIYSAIAAVIGAIFGLTLGFILRFFKMQLSLGKCLILVVGLILLAGLSGFITVRNYVNFNGPRVIYSDGRLSKIMISERKVRPNNQIVPFEQRETGKSILWNSAKPVLSFPFDKIIVRDSTGNIIIQTSLNKFDYIRELQAAEVKLSPTEKNFLAILADLRATSNHTMLLIYSPNGQLIYQEMFDTREHKIMMALDTLPGSDSEKLFITNKAGAFAYFLKTGN